MCVIIVYLSLTMLIDLKECAKNGQKETLQLSLSTRMPHRVVVPCSLHCIYSVKAMSSYFLISLEVCGDITIECQRCLKEFLYNYSNKTTLAICNSEAQAQKLMDNYECIVTKVLLVNLVELITDELHLYSPEHHLAITECDEEVSKFIHFSTNTDDKL